MPQAKFQTSARINLLFHWIGRLILKILGWEVDGVPPKENKYVAIVAPHTSNWDFPMALFISYSYRIKGAWLGKSQIFHWPVLGWFFKIAGGIPIDRSHPQGLVAQAVKAFREGEHLILALAPEGTRSKVDFWKSGFYHIAREAGVPIALCYLDFKRKVGGFGPLYYCTGNVQQDLKFINDFYNTITPRHPEKRSEARFKPVEE